MPNDKTQDQTEQLTSTITTEEIRQLTKDEQDKTFSTFESNRREKEKAEEMMPESFEDDDIPLTDEENEEE